MFSDFCRNSKPIKCVFQSGGEDGKVVAFLAVPTVANSKPRKCVCLSGGEDGEVVVFLAVPTVILSRKSVSVSWVQSSA